MSTTEVTRALPSSCWCAASLLVAVSLTVVARAEDPPATTAFVHVRVVPMDRDGALADQTVVVRGERIVSLGPSDTVEVPPGANTIDGSGLTLLPGLTDAHAHLEVSRGARPDFGDAPLYLSHGVTTVWNLRGLPYHLDWRRRIEDGRLLAPHLVTSGEFVEEPRVDSPQEAAREVAAQKSAGYDLVKTHQVLDTKEEEFITSAWMDAPTYHAVHEAARRSGLGVVGHGPYKLGLAAALERGHALAHVNELNPLWFFPVRDSDRAVAATLLGLLGLVLLALVRGAVALVRRLRGRADPVPSPSVRGLRRWSGVLALVVLAALACFLLLMPGGLLFGHLPVVVVFTLLGALVVLAAGLLALDTWRAWRETGVPWPARLHGTLATVSALAIALSLLHWLPVAWRNTDRSIRQVARDYHQAGMWMQSTLVIQQSVFGGEDGFGREAVLADPAFRALPVAMQKDWREMPPLPSVLLGLFRGYPAFTRRLLKSLHEEGVPILAGTDAGGVPLVLPGSGLHAELSLLRRCGLTNHEVLWTATVGPATFLGRLDQAGTVSPGRRADLILVRGDPLADLACLRQPVGVMARGRWLPREELDRRVAALTS